MKVSKKFNISPTLGLKITKSPPRNLIDYYKGCPTMPRACPNLPKIFNFDFIEFSMTIFFNI
jgi:hypothetical protein